SDDRYRATVTRAWKLVPTGVFAASLRLINPAYFVSTIIRVLLWNPLGGWGGSHSLLQKLGLVISAYEKTVNKLSAAEKEINALLHAAGLTKSKVSGVKDAVKAAVAASLPRSGRPRNEFDQKLFNEPALIFDQGFPGLPNVKIAISNYAELLFRKAEKEQFSDFLGSDDLCTAVAKFFTVSAMPPCIPPLLHELYRGGDFGGVVSETFRMIDDILRFVSAYDVKEGSTPVERDDDPSENIIKSIEMCLRERVAGRIFQFAHHFVKVCPRGHLFKMIDWIIRYLCKPFNEDATSKPALELFERLAEDVEGVVRRNPLAAEDLLQEVQEFIAYRRDRVPRRYWKAPNITAGELTAAVVDRLAREMLGDNA
ncbi:MAG: hypothetical protein BJ554DRAFT_7114, partial [Olpidium bornovanus]